jgi:hypothetical protein
MAPGTRFKLPLQGVHASLWLLGPGSNYLYRVSLRHNTSGMFVHRNPEDQFRVKKPSPSNSEANEHLQRINHIPFQRRLSCKKILKKVLNLYLKM